MQPMAWSQMFLIFSMYIEITIFNTEILTWEVGLWSTFQVV